MQDSESVRQGAKSLSKMTYDMELERLAEVDARKCNWNAQSAQGYPFNYHYVDSSLGVTSKTKAKVSHKKWMDYH